MRVRAYLSMCFGDPWEGVVPLTQVIAVATRMMALGCTELSLGDTIGVATPGRVAALLDGLVDAKVPIERTAVHFHDTYGQALANTLEALAASVAAPTPRAPRATSPQKTCCGSSTGWASARASTSPSCARRAHGSPRSWVAPAPPAPFAR